MRKDFLALFTYLSARQYYEPNAPRVKLPHVLSMAVACMIMIMTMIAIQNPIYYDVVMFAVINSLINRIILKKMQR